MELTYVPILCKPDKDGNPPNWAGSVTVKIPNYFEKYAILDAIELGFDELGQVNEMDAKAKISFMVKLAKASKGFYVSVELTRLSDNQRITSFDEMVECEDCHNTISEVAAKILGGFQAEVRGNA